MKKQIGAILAACAILSGCAGGTQPQVSADAQAPAAASQEATAAASQAPAAADSTQATAAPAAAAPIQVTAVLQLNPEIVLDNNPVVQMIDQDLNVDLKIEAPPQNGYSDRVKILLSTGDMPDLVHYGADIFATQWAQQGLLLDVTDLIQKYPNLQANISKEQYGDCVFLPDGRIYGIPRPNSYDEWGYVINKKWLDKLGLQPPKTVDDFVSVCTAFTTQDPDGNGVADTFGVSFNAQQTSTDSGIWHLQNDFFAMAYSISDWHYGMPDVDGTAKIRALKSKYPDYMQKLRSMYDAGIIDKAFVTYNADENYVNIAQNRVGIVGASEKNYTTALLQKYSMNPDDFEYEPPLVLKEGDSPVYAMPPSNWMAYYVNAASSPEKQDAALRILDWGNSEKGFIAMQLGIAGQDYNTYDLETRTIDRTDAQYDHSRAVASNMFAFANAYQGKEALMGGSTPQLAAKWQTESAAAEAVTKKCYFGFTKMLDNIGTDHPDEVTGLNSLEVRYITGEATLDELMNYVNTVYAPAVAAYQQQLQDYMTVNPPRWVS